MTEITPAEREREQLREAAVTFGANLRHWRRRQGWAQDTAMDWGKATGRLHVYSSQWSSIESGSTRNPGPTLFVAFGVMNTRLACADYGAVRDRTLMDRLKAAEPLRHKDGEPWDAADFFAAYIGHQAWPDVPDPEPPEISDEQAAQWSATLRGWFQATAAAAGMEPLDAAVAVMRHADPDRGDHREFQRLILGFSDLSAEWLREQWRQEAQSPAAWIAAWRKELGLPAEALTAPWNG